MTREKGADGQVHFRYRHTEQEPFGGNYDRLAIPPAMAFLDAAQAPAAPGDVDIVRNGSSFELTWNAGDMGETDPLRRFAIFRNVDANPDTTDSGHLVAILGPDARSYSETLSIDAESHPYYRVVAQSLLGITSSSAIVTTDPSPVNAGRPDAPLSVGINSVYPNPATSTVTIGFTSDAPTSYRLIASDVTGRTAVNTKGEATAGRNEISIDVSQLASGIYLLQIDLSGHMLTTKLVVAH